MEYFRRQYSMCYNPIPHNINHHHIKRHRHSIDSCSPHSQHKLNLLHKKYENFDQKFSSPVHKNSNKRHISTLPASIYQCYETPTDSRTKPDFQSLHLHTFKSSERKRSRGISHSRDYCKKS